jgi:hypothetical protein
MQRDLFLDGLRFKLAEQYRENPTGFLSLSKEAFQNDPPPYSYRNCTSPAQ